MACGDPVACSNVSSLPEVAGDAALLFDPDDVAEMAAVLERLLADADLRARLTRRGRQAAVSRGQGPRSRRWPFTEMC